MTTPPPAASPKPLALRWSQNLGVPLRGLALAREKNWLLAWDQGNWLYLLNHAGQRQGQAQLSGAALAACCAEDGSAYAALDSQGQVVWLAPDLMPRWKQSVPATPLAVAMDALGNYLAVADQRGSLHVFDAFGNTVKTMACPRPLQHLAFVPAAPYLLASADFGLIGAVDLTGNWLWRDGPVVHVGGLATSGDGAHTLLACFSEGLRRYGPDGKFLGAFSVGDACRLVAQAYDGSRIVAADMNQRLHLLDAQGNRIDTHACGKPIAGLAMGALGDFLAVALADGEVRCLA